MAAPVLQVRALEKTYRIGFFRKRVEAVRGVDFEVREGEIFGLLGPNGAGKTSTIKMILRLTFPTAGDVSIFGQPPGTRETMKRVGYMPENPYVYQYLKPTEFLDLCGRLVGMDGKTRRKRADELIEQVGLSHARERAIGKFSKGMTQRIGLAQALLHDPELLILDEPMSGLDPVGRKQVRDLLVAQRDAGKTLIFTSHILSDVEMLCDRVTIMQRGKVAARGTMDELLRTKDRRVIVELKNVSDSLLSALREQGEIREERDQIFLTIVGDPADTVTLAAASGAQIISVIPQRDTLENLFMREAVSLGATEEE